MLTALFPEPAFSLVSFERERFVQICTMEGLYDLLKHSMGIFPEIDSTKKMGLQFLPFDDELQKNVPVVLGNSNYVQAQSTLKMYT